jgi:hypothetical protein
MNHGAKWQRTVIALWCALIAGVIVLEPPMT